MCLSGTLELRDKSADKEMRMHAVRILIGFTDGGMPVYSMRGGAPEGDEGSDAGDNGDPTDEGEEDSGQTEDEYTPPTKEEFAKLQDRLKRANGEAGTRRKWLEEHGINPRTGVPYAQDDEEDEEDSKPKRPAVKAKAKAEEDDDSGDSSRITEAELKRLDKLRKVEGKKAAAREATLVSALTKSAATIALQEAGWNGKGKTIIDRMIDLGEVDIDDEGNIVGLEEQISEVKAEMPDWFKPVRRAAPKSGGARDVDGAEKPTKRSGDKQMTWLDKLSAQIDGEG
jgi:hypothetical protein